MITPLRNRIIGRPVVDKESGVIEIPDQFKQSQTVEVIAVGTEVKLPISVGQRLLLHPNAAWTNLDGLLGGDRLINVEYVLAIMETT